MQPSITFILLAGLIGLAAAGYLMLRPRMLHWGAAPNEANAILGGDELISDPIMTTTRAISIEAEPKKNTHRRLGRSPDWADSFFLAVKAMGALGYRTREQYVDDLWNKFATQMHGGDQEHERRQPQEASLGRRRRTKAVRVGFVGQCREPLPLLLHGRL